MPKRRTPDLAQHANFRSRKKQIWNGSYQSRKAVSVEKLAVDLCPAPRTDVLQNGNNCGRDLRLQSAFSEQQNDEKRHASKSCICGLFGRQWPRHHKLTFELCD